ncbi:phosphatase PAP2 family protein [Deinococcus multiflagellatus]|uniref:Phosphatase PAP2 family protein n=1 Tax=Deinococcus multiflagellatus TaxID=1656887 RepID=A0ABW1ZUM9_9DEIO|nr:phosphatase PAP2 family protein [Deinococcus multiflagellatus]MBZ9715428.1 phosphatase PAP2 family protein [Deinococcus multiflagellatus]
MLAVHAGASTALNNVTRFLSLFGNMAGMVPLTGLLSVMLYRIRPRLAYFLLLALGGTVAINTVLKQFFDRPRPAFWTPFLPEPDFSFPSGHAMFASALVSAVVVILWSTRWRLPALVCGALYVLAMMWSWVYIGVHYPTDVTAGALVSVAWVVGLNYVLHVHRILRPAPAASAERPGEERGRQETSSAQ